MEAGAVGRRKGGNARKKSDHQVTKMMMSNVRDALFTLTLEL
jgi:hypothetical protein